MSRRNARYEQAVRALCQNGIDNYEAGITEEAPACLNDAVIDAERGVPPWRRWAIRRRIIRELDYWSRTGGFG